MENFVVCMMLWQEAEGSSRVACRPGRPLFSPQGSQISLALLGTPQYSSNMASGMKRASSRVEAGTSVFLSLSDFDQRVSAELEQERQSSSCVEEWNSAFLSCCSRGDRTLVTLYLEPTVFYGGSNWGVSSPSCWDFILRVTFKDMPGHRDLL